MSVVFQKREIVILDVHSRFEKKHIDDFLKSKKYQICSSKIDTKVNVEFITSKVAREVKDFLENKELIFHGKELRFSLKGNRFLIESTVTGSFGEIRNFFLNYGEVNNVYHTKKYFATLSSIKQAVELVEIEKAISIDGTRMQVRYAFDRNIGNLNNPNKNFQIKSKGGNTTTNNDPSTSRLNGSKSPAKKPAFNGKEAQKILQPQKATVKQSDQQATAIKQNNQPSTAFKSIGQQATAIKQNNQPLTALKQIDQQATAIKQNNQPPTALKQIDQQATAIKQNNQLSTIFKQVGQKTTAISQKNQPSTASKQIGQQATVIKQNNQPSIGEKIENSSKATDKDADKTKPEEVPKSRKRTRKRKNKSGSENSSNESINKTNSTLNSSTKENQDIKLLDGLSSSVPNELKFKEFHPTFFKNPSELQKTNASSNIGISNENLNKAKNSELKNSAKLFAKGPNSATPFSKCANKNVDSSSKNLEKTTKSSLGAIQNTINSLHYKSKTFKPVDYLEQKIEKNGDQEELDPNIVRTYYNRRPEATTRPPPFAKQFEIKRKETEEKISPELVDTSVVTAKSSPELVDTSIATAKSSIFHSANESNCSERSLSDNQPSLVSTLNTPEKPTSNLNLSSDKIKSSKKNDICGLQ